MNVVPSIRRGSAQVCAEKKQKAMLAQMCVHGAMGKTSSRLARDAVSEVESVVGADKGEKECMHFLLHVYALERSDDDLVVVLSHSDALNFSCSSQGIDRMLPHNVVERPGKSAFWMSFFYPISPDGLDATELQKKHDSSLQDGHVSVELCSKSVIRKRRLFQPPQLRIWYLRRCCLMRPTT